VNNVKHRSRLQKPLPATATAIDLTSLVLLASTIFNVLGFFTDWITTFFNFAINLGLFFFGELA